MTLITELGNLFAGMPGANTTYKAQENTGDSFQNIISDMTTKADTPEYESVEIPRDDYKEDVSVAPMEEASKATYQEETVIKETEKTEASTETKNNEENALNKEDVSEIEQKILSEAAETLGVEEETILNALESMGIGVMDLLNPQNVTALVANIKSGGDMTALVTNEELSGLVMELNAAVETILSDASEVMNMDVETLQGLLEKMDTKVTDGGEMQGNIPAVTDEEIGEETVITEESNKEVPTGEEDLANTTKADATVVEGEAGQREGMTEGNAGGDAQSRFTGRESLQQTTAEVVNNVMPTNTPENFVEAVVGDEMPTMGSSSPSEIVSQVVEQMKLRVRADVTQLSMQLNPENLGTVGLTITSKEGNVTAQLLAQNDAVRAALESQIMVLRENLEQQGVRVDAIEVAVASHEFERNLEQGNEENKQQEDAMEELKKATRKIDLSGVSDLEALGEELEEAEMVTAKMMQADGNSMDYKV